jgi:solute carrier family 24 (sodium/potassium/calcium exchanger), member 6
VSQKLGLSQSFAGVTLLALGNGSPDLFSTYAALKAGSGSLAIGELVGAAFFITSVVAGSMAIITPFKVSRKSFLRDAVSFCGAVAISVALLAHGKVEIWETSCMVAYYIGYVMVVVILTWLWRKRARERRTIREHIQHPNQERVRVDVQQGSEARVVNERTRLLEQGSVPDLAISLDTEMAQGYANLQQQMRLLRPSFDRSSSMLSPHGLSLIRPSLLGALEVNFN